MLFYTLTLLVNFEVSTMMLQVVEGRNNVDSSSFPFQLLDWGFEKDFE
jgi:hypothetical protein